MNEYTIYKLYNDNYNYFILCLISESIINYLNQVEQELNIINSNGVLLIDQLLITGNNTNRYFSCKYINGKILLSTAKIITPTNEQKKLSLKLLKENINYIQNSILTDKQKTYIKIRNFKA